MDTTTLSLLFTLSSSMFHLPDGMLSALCHVESQHNVIAVHHDDGKSASLGVCQVKLSTARFLGFPGSQHDLMDPYMNIHYAAKYLRRQLDRYGGNYSKGIAAYNAGSCRFNSKGLIKNRKYVEKVLQAWDAEK